VRLDEYVKRLQTTADEDAMAVNMAVKTHSAS
jgi:division protein CdvB (Snf7/Vps24/ESCRT-III family)